MNIPFARRLSDGNFQHGGMGNTVSISHRSQERQRFFRKTKTGGTFLHAQSIPHIAVQVNVRTGGASSPVLKHGAFALAPGKPYRFSQTATPDQLLPLPAQQALMAVWGLRVRFWQRRPEQTPTWRWGRDSEPLEPEHVGIRCPSHILHSLRIRTLLDLLEMELERGLRLLLASRGRYWSEDRQVPLTGVLGRIGQMYRELEQRRDKSSALTTLLLELATLPGGIGDGG